MNRLQMFLLLTAMFLVKYASGDSSSEPLESVSSAVRREMEAVRTYTNTPVGPLVRKYGYSVVAAVEEYTKDEDERVRSYAYFYMDVATSQSTNVVERLDGVGKLLKGVFASPEADRAIMDRLIKKYRSKDFSASSLELLSEKLAECPTYELILLVGVADDTSQSEKLKEIRDSVKEPLKPWGIGAKKEHSWAFAAMMARARMGEKDDVRRCIELVQSYPDEDVRLGILHHRLSYVRQPEVVEYLKGYLLDNRDESGSPKQLKMTYGQRAMVALSEMIEGFPPFKGMPQEEEKKLDSIPAMTQYCYEWLNKQEKLNIIR